MAATWPVAADPGRDVAGDLGDSILNMWILAWDIEQFRAIASGDLSRLARFFDANIFHPAPLTLAYSEHLIPQALQALPVYLVSGNPILVYNLLFLSTFVLSGFGTYLFVRELTGSAAAGFVAGLVFAFAPYRLAQTSHLHVLSSQWMPFVLYGLRRYADTRRLRPLAGASAALLVQGLSTGYYLVFFTPVAAAYAAWEVTRRRLWRDVRFWLPMAAAGLLVALLTLPLLLPYLALRDDGLVVRSRAEVVRYSADVYSYVTAFPGQRFWGARLQTLPKPEGELFPGLVAVLLAVTGIAAWRSAPREPAARLTGARRWLAAALGATAVIYLVAAVATSLERRILIEAGPFALQMSDVTQLLLRAAVAFALLLAVSPRVRQRARAFAAERGFFVAALAATVWLSLGPAPQALGRPLDLAAPYSWLYEHVPGFEGLRVPARFAMVGLLMLATLAGFGATALLRLRRGALLLALVAAALFVENTIFPFPVNVSTAPRGFQAPEPRLVRPARAPVVYREAARLPGDAVLIDLPLGVAEYDLRAMYYSIAHQRPLLNGYSGLFPLHYGLLSLAVRDIPRDPSLALQAMREAGATHAIVHEAAYFDAAGAATTAALMQHGAVELFRSGDDVLLALPR